MNYALTIYPLSKGYRDRFERSVGCTPTYVNLAELRRLPLLQMLGRLRGLKGGRLFLTLEEESGRSVLPVLAAVAGVTSARHVEIFYPDLRTERISRWRLAPGLVQLLASSAVATSDAWQCRQELRQLERLARVDASAETSGAVLYVNANLWFGIKAGGSVGHIAGVANALRENGADVVFASVGGRTMIHPAIPSIVLHAPQIFGLPYELNYYRFHRSTVRQLAKQFNEARPAYLYQRMSLGNYAGVSLSRLWRIPLVLEFNGSEVWVAKHWGRPLRYDKLAAAAEAVCLRHAHLVVTISEVLRDELLDRGVEPERIVCYPNCVDPKVFDPARFSGAQGHALRRRLGIAEDAVVATFIGTFGEWHGVDLLAEAIKLLVDQDAPALRRAKLHFLLVGDGLKMPLVREILEGSRYEPFYTLTGLVPQEQAPDYLNASDVLLSPHVANADGSRFFGSPTKLFEYMAMGKGIVASDLDQIGQILRDSLSVEHLPEGPPASNATALSVLVPPGDVAALAQGIRFMVENPAWRTLLGQNARREALAKYTWRHHVSAITNALDRLRS